MVEGIKNFLNNNILHKPIGLMSKSYGFMDKMLRENIGSHLFEHDGYSTIIGMNANPYLNNDTNPWYELDEERKKYFNYLTYVNNTYFHGTMLPPNFQRSADMIRLFDYNSLIEENSYVGAIHSFDMDSVMNARLLIPNGATNPNGYNDTRLGIINNFYLSTMLYNSYGKMMNKSTSSYHNPSFGYDENTIANSFSVTQGAYSKFGLKGEYGIENGTYYAREGMVMPQSLLTNDIISWSTADHLYYSNNNLNRVGGMLGVDSDLLSYNMTDNTKSNAVAPVYSPFGNFYSLTYSLGLITASGGRTRDFIMKSILGVDLMDDKDYGLILKENDVVSLKKLSRKKYFASLGTRGTNYIDQMTNIDVKFDTLPDNEFAVTRLQLNDPGNDTFYSYNTFLTYAENDGAKNMGDFNYSVGNSGISVGNYKSYTIGGANEKKDIIDYTNRHFKKNKYNTLIARFHTDSFDNPLDSRLKKDQTSSAVSQYGMSHGRNLLKRDHKNSYTNEYHDPYCRVWTYHKQYSKYTDLIRPFTDDRTLLDDRLGNSYQKNRLHLIENGVKSKTSGLLKIVPEKDDLYKKCMFSIENLAWKKSKLFQDSMFSHEKGPNGGRIMWFPPYGLSFNENIKPNWNPTQFIGRGEKIYSYVDTERSGTLSFQMLIDHPSILNAAHNASDVVGDVDDVNSKEQQILRFFAGCEVLGEEIKKKEEVAEEKPNAEPPVIIPTSTIEEASISFDVYFPNNYSGVDDDSTTAIKYLCFGLGYDTIPVDNKVFSLDEKGEKIVGGYEQLTSENVGVSLLKKWDNEDEHLGTVYEVPFEKNGLTVLEVTSFKCKNKNGKNNFWGYRVDNAYAKQVLSTKNQYLDTISYGLNAKSEKIEGMKTFSFNDFVSFMGTCKDVELGDYAKVKELKALLENCEVKKVETFGYSTSHGYSDLNKKLAENRAKTIEKWLKTNNIFKNAKFEPVKLEDNRKVQGEDINSEDAKKNRKTRVRIFFVNEKIVTNEIKIEPQVFTKFPDVEDFQPKFPDVSNIKPNIDVKMLSNINYYDNINYSEIKNSNKNNVSNSLIGKMSLGNTREYLEKISGDVKNMLSSFSEDKKIQVNGGNSYNEYDFFNHIESGNTILRNKIVEKIKYFDPAYHSITPEGFNNRLTFLHQCTRQGPTNSSSDTNGFNVRNLSFGAPPICVLRIGDFYNTKIIIDSISISYDEASWDLNDEGIGVMPMLAKVDINFNFIGGSDLSGPISKLQNAMSFNYYANTRVYNNNSDINKPKK